MGLPGLPEDNKAPNPAFQAGKRYPANALDFSAQGFDSCRGVDQLSCGSRSLREHRQPPNLDER